MAKEAVVAALKGIPAAKWLEIIIVMLTAAVFIGIVYAGYLNNVQLTTDNHEAIKVLSANDAEQKKRDAEQMQQFQSVSRSLATTEKALAKLVDRMNEQDIDDSRREAEIRHNEAEINRLRDDGAN